MRRIPFSRLLIREQEDIVQNHKPESKLNKRTNFFSNRLVSILLWTKCWSTFNYRKFVCISIRICLKLRTGSLVWDRRVRTVRNLYDKINCIDSIFNHVKRQIVLCQITRKWLNFCGSCRFSCITLGTRWTFVLSPDHYRIESLRDGT